MEESTLWLETDYFENFRCKGGACRNSCCEGWRISVSMKEYFDLIGRECSEELHRRLESAFVTPEYPSPEKFRQIAPNWQGLCPMHGEDGLCMLHCECGADALPEICRVYPRSLKREGQLNQACCSCSCEAVIELLMQENQLHFRMAEMNIQPEYTEKRPQEMMKTCAECMWMLQNRDIPLAERIAGICAQLGAEKTKCGEAEALEKLMGVLETLAGDSASIGRFGKAALQRYGAGDVQKYRADIAAFEARFPLWERWLENVLANHFIYADFPCVDDRISEAQACGGLCLAYALLRVMCAPCASQQEVVDTIAGAFRLVEHSAFYYNARILKNPLDLLAL